MLTERATQSEPHRGEQRRLGQAMRKSVCLWEPVIVDCHTPFSLLRLVDPPRRGGPLPVAPASYALMGRSLLRNVGASVLGPG